MEDGDMELNAALGAKVGLSAAEVECILRAAWFAGGA